MFWSEKIPLLKLQNGDVELSIIAGEYNGVKGLPPPPESWAGSPESHTAIWLVKMKKGSKFVIPKSPTEVSRMIYFFNGDEMKLNNNHVDAETGLEMDSQFEVEVRSEKSEIEFLQKFRDDKESSTRNNHARGVVKYGFNKNDIIFLS